MEPAAGSVTQPHAHPPIPPDRPRLTGPRLGPGGLTGGGVLTSSVARFETA